MGRFSNIPYGSIKAVAADMGVSVSLVSKVARGERRNALIEEALTKKVLENKARVKRIERMKARLAEVKTGTIDTSKPRR